jgi:hypothetical protein
VVVVVVGGVVVGGVVAPAPPEVARTSATPESSPAKNVVTAVPFRVCASTGSTRPKVVVKRTTVPFCTGVPPDSITVADTSVLPPTGSTRLSAFTLIVEFVGAVS